MRLPILATNHPVTANDLGKSKIVSVLIRRACLAVIRSLCRAVINAAHERLTLLLNRFNVNYMSTKTRDVTNNFILANPVHPYWAKPQAIVK